MVTRSCRGEIAITKNLSLTRRKNTGRSLIKENDTKTIDYLWVIGIFLEEYTVNCGGWCLIQLQKLSTFTATRSEEQM